jgi:hypothetical protein
MIYKSKKFYSMGNMDQKTGWNRLFEWPTKWDLQKCTACGQRQRHSLWVMHRLLRKIDWTVAHTINIWWKADCSSFVMCPILVLHLPRAFLRQLLIVLTIQTRKAVHTINQSIFLRCLWPMQPAHAAGNSCVSGHWKNNGATCGIKAKTFPLHTHLLSLNKDTNRFNLLRN